MISINLIKKKKKTRLPVVLGLDLAKVKWIQLSIALAINFFIYDFTTEEWRQEITKINAQESKLIKKVNSLSNEIKKHGDIKKQLEAFNEQVNVLKKRSEQVAKILSTKKNPKNILEKIASNTPADLWLDEIIINKEDDLNMKGQSTSYKSIGDFISNINRSSFFDHSIQMQNSNTEEKSYDGQKKRVEVFQVVGKIVQYGSINQ